MDEGLSMVDVELSAAELYKLIEQAIDTGNWDPIGTVPKASCSCNGTGRIGRDTKTNKYVICRCITKQIGFIRSYATNLRRA